MKKNVIYDQDDTKNIIMIKVRSFCYEGEKYWQKNAPQDINNLLKKSTSNIIDFNNPGI